MISEVTVAQQILVLVCYVSVVLIRKIAKRTRTSTFDCGHWRGQRRERLEVREKPKGPRRMTDAKQVDVLRSGPTLSENVSIRALIFAFVYCGLSTLNKPVILILLFPLVM